MYVTRYFTSNMNVKIVMINQMFEKQMYVQIKAVLRTKSFAFSPFISSFLRLNFI